MAITGLHLLQTLQCTFECDHCFVYSSPNALGVMKISDIRKILSMAKQVDSVKWIFFEGGEPFLYYQTLLWGLRAAGNLGYKCGVVTNAYWATSVEDAEEWLTPIRKIGVSALSISDDAYHYGSGEENLAKHAFEAAQNLGLPVDKIVIEDSKKQLEPKKWKGKPVVEGRVLFKGRAAEKLVEGLPTKPWTQFEECKAEDFSNQTRVHIDPFGHVHVCQGITIGNVNNVPLLQLFENFNPDKHPICSPILKGGPAELARKHGVPHQRQYVDECHLCYSTRQKLRTRFPKALAPSQFYGSS